MRMRDTLLATILVVLFASGGNAQAPATNQDAPDFRVQVWGYIGADFSARVGDYFDLRSQQEKGLPALQSQMIRLIS